MKRVGFTEEIAHTVDLVFKDTGDELEIETPSVIDPVIPLSESLIIIKPLEFITSHVVISGQAATNKEKDLTDLSIKESSLTSTRQTQSSSTEH